VSPGEKLDPEITISILSAGGLDASLWDRDEICCASVSGQIPASEARPGSLFYPDLRPVNLTQPFEAAQALDSAASSQSSG